MTTITTRVNKTTELNYGEGDANIDRDVITAASDPGQTNGSDNRSVYECTGTFNFTIPQSDLIVLSPPTVGQPWNDYSVTIKNIGSGVITVKTRGTDTLDGAIAPGNQIINANEAFKYVVNNGRTGYISTGKVSANAVSATAVIGDNLLIRGDGALRGAQASGITVSDANSLTGVASITASGTITGGIITDGTASITGGAITGLTTPLTVPQGGTGVASATDGGVVLGSGAGALSVTAKGSVGQVLTGTAGDPAFAAPAVPSYVRLIDAKASGVAPASGTTGTWIKRECTEDIDVDAICVVTANVIVLSAGTYDFSATVMNGASSASGHIRLQNTSDVVTEVLGLSHSAASFGAAVAVPFSGRFTVGASKNLEIQHRQGIGGLFGQAANAGVNEQYLIVEFWKVG